MRRIHRIPDAKYEDSDLNTVMAGQCQHLNTKENYMLMSLLRKFEDLFDGTLGTWNTTPVDLELNYDVKPVCSRPYSVPRVHGVMFKK